MNSSFFVSFKNFFILYVFLYIFFSIIFISIISQYPNINFVYDDDNFIWPIPGYTTITSNFGYRVAPTTGSSTYHSGIDIGAPEGAEFYAIFSGKITMAEFSGAGGYSIVLENDEYKVSYCHCSPNFIVYVGEFVKKGDIIGNVGPKNVYGVPNNSYTDSNGNPTNGATTGTHLHFSIKLKSENMFLNPLDYVSKNE